MTSRDRIVAFFAILGLPMWLLLGALAGAALAGLLVVRLALELLDQ